MDLRRLLAVGLALAVLAGGCGDVGEPDLGVLPTTTTATTVDLGAAPGPDAVAGGTVDQDVITGPGTRSFVTQLTPARPVDFSPQVLLADFTGVRLLEGDVLLPGVVADRVLDDPTGGLVIEAPEDGQHQIVWYPAGQDRQVVSEGPARLMDVSFVDGSVHVVLADEDELRLVRLGEPEERILTVLDPESSVVSASAAAGLYVLALRNEACGSVQFLSPDGATLDVGGVAEPPCTTPGRPTFGLVAFSPDGDTFAYTERTFRSDSAVASTELVVRDLHGTELHRSQVGTEGQQILSLSLDRHLVALLRETATGTEVVRLDLRQPADLAVTPAPGARSASLTRVPLAASAPGNSG